MIKGKYVATIELNFNVDESTDGLLPFETLQAKVTGGELDRAEERSKGCEYCADHKYNVEDCVMLSHDKSDFDSGMYIYDGELISNSGEFQCVRINFCPMCGRPLKGEDNGKAD